MSACTYPSRAVLDRAREVDQRLRDVLAADDEAIPMILKAMEVEKAVEKALEDEPAGGSLAALARMR